MSIDAAPPSPEKGAEVADCGCGEPMSALACESEGEPRDSLGLLPPSPLAPPCAKLVTAEGNCECDDDGIVRLREEYSSCCPDCCCTPVVFEGEKGDEDDEMDELRLML